MPFLYATVKAHDCYHDKKHLNESFDCGKAVKNIIRNKKQQHSTQAFSEGRKPACKRMCIRVKQFYSCIRIQQKQGDDDRSLCELVEALLKVYLPDKVSQESNKNQKIGEDTNLQFIIEQKPAEIRNVK